MVRTYFFIIADSLKHVYFIGSNCKFKILCTEFLGRTEVRVSDILQDSTIYRGPLVKRLPLHEVESGEIVLKLDLQLFSRR